MDTDDIIGLCVFATVLTLLALIAWRAVQGRAPGVVLLVERVVGFTRFV